jgi:DNA-binding response OmpR family regulator
MSPPHEGVTVGELVVDLAGWRVMVRGRRVDLAPLEFKLLAYLARRVGRVATYDELLEDVWDCPADLGDRHLIISCVDRLRKKVENDPSRPEYVINVRRVGYRLRSQHQWEEAVRRAQENR